MNKPKATGTAAESAVVKAARTAGLHAERRALTGSLDQGDVWIRTGDNRIHGVIDSGRLAVVEVKSRKGAHSLGDVDRWLAEADRECENAVAAGAPVDVSALIVKRVGSGTANAADWTVYLRPADAVWVLTGADHFGDSSRWVAMTLGMFLERLALR